MHPIPFPFFPLDLIQEIMQRNEGFKELILVRMAEAAIFQSQKSNKYILWFYYNLDKKALLRPLLWTYAFQTINFTFYILYILVSWRPLYMENGII